MISSTRIGSIGYLVRSYRIRVYQSAHNPDDTIDRNEHGWWCGEMELGEGKETNPMRYEPMFTLLLVSTIFLAVNSRGESWIGGGPGGPPAPAGGPPPAPAGGPPPAVAPAGEPPPAAAPARGPVAPALGLTPAGGPVGLAEAPVGGGEDIVRV